MLRFRYLFEPKKVPFLFSNKVVLEPKKTYRSPAEIHFVPQNIYKLCARESFATDPNNPRRNYVIIIYAYKVPMKINPLELINPSP